MRRIIILLVFMMIFLTSFASSETINNIIINQQPDSVYNLGETITIPITIIDNYKTILGNVYADLFCNGQYKNFYHNGISLAQGQRKDLEPSLVLMNDGLNTINNSLGYCRIGIRINNGDNLLTNQFKLSNSITITKDSPEVIFTPGEYFFVKGNATKENGIEVNGFVEMNIMEDNSSRIQQTGTVSGGNFLINISLPKDMKAGTYLIKLKVYDKDMNGIETNTGFMDFYMGVKQVPASLEVVFANQDIMPGTNLQVKAVLHDQSGEKMNSTSFITIKDSNGRIMEQTQNNADEFLEFPINHNEAPSEWKIFAVSSQLTAESTFRIMENEKVKVDLINKTVIVTNIGNVPYNKTMVIRISNSSFPIDVFLKVDENKKYIMTAPEGGYNIEVTTSEGDRITGMATLTGKSLNVSEASGEGIMMFIRNPIVWIFIILVLGMGTFMIFNKTRKRSFFGFMSKERIKKDKNELMTLSDDRTFVKKASSKAELSLSIKGEKQEVSLVCLKIRNFGEFSSKGDVRETLDKINQASEGKKAVLYESQDSLFYIFAPMRTKTFQNEASALKLAQEAADILLNHNRLYKHKLEFGISLNYGDIIAKQEDTLKIMSLGTLMTSSKKIASLAKNEVLISENMNAKIMRMARTQGETRDNVKVYILKGIKEGNEEHRKFIDNFSKRYEAEKRNNNQNNYSE